MTHSLANKNTQWGKFLALERTTDLVGGVCLILTSLTTGRHDKTAATLFHLMVRVTSEWWKDKKRKKGVQLSQYMAN